jgi:hypothetical protein
MTLSVRIDRLVLDPRALPPAHVPAFRAALAEALGRLQLGAAAPRPGGRVDDLAERTAQAIHARIAPP